MTPAQDHQAGAATALRGALATPARVPHPRPGDTTARTACSFETFYARYEPLWIRHAYACTGDIDTAEQITDALTAHLAQVWTGLPSPERAARHAWKVLKSTITRWHIEHGTASAFVETAVFDRVARAMAAARDQFAAMEESLGLYSAISRLPKRQHDAVVLHYVLEYPYATVAELLGISEADARANVCHAKKRLARELGLPNTLVKAA